MSILQFFKEVQAELKEVTWPTRNQTISYSVLVVLISVLVSLFLGGVDFGLKSLLAFLLK